MGSPAQPTAGIARLSAPNRWAALRLLRERPDYNAYLLAQIARGAIDHDDVAGPLIGYWLDGELVGVAVFGSNLVLSHPCADEAVVAFAKYARRSGFRAWVAVGEDGLLDRFMETYGRRQRGIRIERPGQLLFALRRDVLDPPAPAADRSLRPADVTELEPVVRADRSMVMEELGFDPFIRDLDSYRRGWLRRVREGRCWVLTSQGGEVVFKVDQSAASEDVVQLAGIWTAPACRRQGLARAGVREMSQELLTRVPLVSLYVHRFNAPAIALYEDLGFERRGLIRSVWFDG